MSDPVQRLQHYPDLEQVLRVVMDTVQARTWTVMPCYLQSWDAGQNTAVLQPAIKLQKRNPDGTLEAYNPPQLIDCPIIWPQGGGFALTFPLVEGDEVLALVPSRNPDGWWQSGGPEPQLPPTQRMHHLSDAFVLAGVRSKPRALGAISTENVQLRNEAGDTYVELTPGGDANVVATGTINATAGGDVVVTSSSGKVTASSPTEIDLTAPLIKLNGVVQASSTIAAVGGITSNNGTHSVGLHTHGGVTTGSGTTGPPTG